ncbi:hypothetical protein DB346_20000 [Verrucomicrobia bacterium LW23]|nr:hypothetical protein DB346_20000 [Verrucomicrobia bacterium LW23]
MSLVQTVDIQAPLGGVFLAAADVARWPEFMPHIRYNRYLSHHPGGGTIRTAATRAGVVLHGVAEVAIDPVLQELRFTHTSSTAGAGTGMTVTWGFKELPDGDTRVTVTHTFSGGAEVRAGVVGRGLRKLFYAEDITALSLQCLKRRVEMQQLSPGASRWI